MDQFDQFYRAKVFSKLDFTSGYQQVKVKEVDIPKIAFKIWYGYYEFLEIPFKVMNSLAIFMKSRNRVFALFLNKFGVVFMGDILVFSKNKEDYATHLRIS